MCSASYLLLVYVPTYLHEQFHVQSSAALIFASIAACIEANGTLIFGWLSDFTGRAKILFFASFLMLLATSFLMLPQEITIVQLLISLIALVIILAAFDGPLTMYLPELFNTNVRYSATAIGYNIGGAAIGGLAPFIMTLLLHYFPSPRFVLGAYLGTFAALACVFVALHSLSLKKKQAEQQNLAYDVI
jgi:MHS family proline/betaine transporter-like MFS transporter